MGFSRQDYWTVLPLPSPEGLVGLHRTFELQLLQHYSSGNRIFFILSVILKNQLLGGFVDFSELIFKYFFSSPLIVVSDLPFVYSQLLF